MKALRNKLILVDNPVNFYGNIGVKLKQEFSTAKSKELSAQIKSSSKKTQPQSIYMDSTHKSQVC